MAAALCGVPRAFTTASLLLTCAPDLLTSCSSPKDGLKVWAFTSRGYNICTGLLLTTGLPLVITHTLAPGTRPSLSRITSSTFPIFQNPLFYILLIHNYHIPNTHCPQLTFILTLVIFPQVSQILTSSSVPKVIPHLTQVMKPFVCSGYTLFLLTGNNIWEG